MLLDIFYDHLLPPAHGRSACTRHVAHLPKIIKEILSEPAMRHQFQSVRLSIVQLHVTEVGLLRKIDLGSGPARYEDRVGDNHHHLACRRCGTVADVDCVVGAAPCLDPSESYGFAIDEAQVTFWGMCTRCQAADT